MATISKIRIHGEEYDIGGGITPHIGENGNWWIGEEDTRIVAQGGLGIVKNETLVVSHASTDDETLILPQAFADGETLKTGGVDLNQKVDSDHFDSVIGDIDTVLDTIIGIQEELMGGG